MIELSRCLQPSAESYVPQGATLYLEVNSPTVTDVVTVSYRFIDLSSGQVFGDSVNCSVAASNDSLSFNIKTNLPECFLLSVSISSLYTEYRGREFVRLKLKSKSGKHLMTYLRGYVTTSEGLTFPPVYLQDALSGIGSHEEVAVDAPLPYQFIVPVKNLWRIRAIYFTMVASAVVADRLPYIEIQNGFAAKLYRIFANDTLQADQGGEYTFLAGGDSRSLLLPGAPDTKYVTTGMGDFQAFGERIININILNVDAGDTLATCWLFYDRLLLPDQPPTV